MAEQDAHCKMIQTQCECVVCMQKPQCTASLCSLVRARAEEKVGYPLEHDTAALLI